MFVQRNLKMTFLHNFQMLVVVFASILSVVNCAIATQSWPPVIVSITPSFGSAEGGTQITIVGANFAQTGIFDSKAVFINNAQCNIINYYTTDTQIVCITPKCTTQTCLSDPNWQGSQQVALEVYVQTVEGILGTSSTFTYNGGYTPAIIKMSSHYAYGTSLSSIVGKLANSDLTDMVIKVDGNLADLGNPDEINPESFYMWSTTNELYFRPPEDMSAGFYNMTYSAQDDQSSGSEGTGLARMWPRQRSLSYAYDYSYQYLFDASPSGRVFNLAMLPSVAVVSPTAGSVAGGTVITLSGSGFSTNLTQNIVFAGGKPCTVLSATVTQITCRTSAALSDDELRSYLTVSHADLQNSVPPTFKAPNLHLNSTRPYGSPGWWVKVKDWTYGNVAMEFGLRQSLSFGFSYNFDYYWYSTLGYNSQSSEPRQYKADFYSIFTAPYTGNYSFYMSVDDSGRIYGAREVADGSFTSETQLLSIPYYTGLGNYFLYPNSIPRTPEVHLDRGERYLLHVYAVNSGGADFVEVAMRIDPAYDSLTGGLIDAQNELADKEETPEISPETVAEFSSTFLEHHALRDVQLISLNMKYHYEVQTVIVSGVTGGTFSLILQQEIATDPLSFSSSTYTIVNALQAAANQLSDAECTSFGVSKTVSSDGTKMYLQITFNTDNSQPLTLMDVYTGELTGNVNVTSFRIQQHTVIPEGSLSLNYTSQHKGVQHFTMDIFSTPLQLQQTLQALNPEITVDVLQSGSRYSGYTWLVTFITPRGEIPLLTVNSSNVYGDTVHSSVTKAQNGSLTSLWFSSIPAYMTEVPLSYATDGAVRSNVEVYVQTNEGDRLKAVCDASGLVNTASAALLKGSESSCNFTYSSKTSAIVSNFSMSTIDAETTRIEIFGNYFTLSGSAGVNVTIADHFCNVSVLTNSYIECRVKSVPWGSFAPVVDVLGFGHAVLGTNATLTFKQSIYSISPSVGSFAGGQVVTILGRGFRPGSVVSFDGMVGNCAVLTWTSSNITCLTPPAQEVFTTAPTMGPTLSPTQSPSVVPTQAPSIAPTVAPTAAPSVVPTEAPSISPTLNPTSPTQSPSIAPSAAPTTTAPSQSPSVSPSVAPSVAPTTSSPTTTAPSMAPSIAPSCAPTQSPTVSPSASPSIAPTVMPSQTPSIAPSDLPTQAPSISPSNAPSVSPTFQPTVIPTESPSAAPSIAPTLSPSLVPSIEPSQAPTQTPSIAPSLGPSHVPTVTPTEHPSIAPTQSPTLSPSVVPTAAPSIAPTVRPTEGPTVLPSETPSVPPSMSPSQVPSMAPSIVPTVAPTDSPTAVPTQSPSLMPSVHPSVVPTDAPSGTPTQTPTIVPSQVPTDAPSVVPTQAPSVVPTQAPSVVPTQAPSVMPTQTPTIVPTQAPSEVPTEAPSVVPTQAPSVVPTLAPSILPTQAPSVVPTQAPSVVPTQAPSVVPTQAPSVVPSQAPSVVPTHAPSILPTQPPTEIPTEEPSVAPTHEPSDIPSAAPWDARRRLSLSQNSYTLLVDGFSSGSSSPLQYTYSMDYTPLVSSFYPTELSAAVTTNMTIVGADLFLSSGQAVTVTIGGQTCTHVMTDGASTVTCTLVRSEAAASLALVYIAVCIESYGCASLVGQNPNVMPSLFRGFSLAGVLPVNGSIAGGGVVTLSGFGFLDGEPSRHSVIFNRVGAAGLSEYDALLVSLGLSSSTKVDPNDALVCTVTEVTFSSLVCTLPHKTWVNASYPDMVYIPTVTLNNVNSFCDVYPGCTYSLAAEFTPMIGGLPWVTGHGDVYTFYMLGELLNDESLQVFIGSTSAASVFVNSSEIFVTTQPLSAGNYPVVAYIPRYGYSLDAVSINSVVAVDSIDFTSPSGSLAGGTLFSISGSGFATKCSDNYIQFIISDNHRVNVSEFVSCTTEKLVLRTPSLLTIESSLATTLRATHSSLAYTVSTISVSAVKNIGYPVFVANPAFNFSLAFTPFALVNRTSGYANQRLNTVVFSHHTGLDSSTMSVSIGGKSCYSDATQSTASLAAALSNPLLAFYSEDCTIPELAATVGSTNLYNVLVDIQPLGYAVTNTSKYITLPTFSSTFLAHSMSHAVTNSSVKGGMNITITGAGFSSAVSVTLCGTACTLGPSVTYSSLSCTIPQRMTTASIEEIQASGMTVDMISTLSGTYYSSLNSPTSSVLAHVHDNDFTSYFSHTQQNCYVGLYVPSGYMAQPYRMRIYPRLNFASSIGTYVFEGSSDGGVTYTTLATGNGAHEGWNFVTASDATASQWFNYFRYRAVETTTTSKCMLAEIDFLGVLGAVNETCPIVVTRGTSFTVGSVAYRGIDEKYTPVVHSIYPNNGTALGGDIVYVKGEHFTHVTSAGQVIVAFSGVNCTVLSHNDTDIKCMTGPRSPKDIRMSSISVYIPGQGFALVDDNAEYLYIDKWSALTSWRNQEPPVEGDVVWIPDGQVILLDVETPLLTFLLVQGDLYFDRTKDHVSVDTYYLFVYGGYMEVGTEENPYNSRATITLHGDRYKTIEIPNVGSKCMVVATKGVPNQSFMTGEHYPGRDVGQIEIHGRKRKRTWTKLNETAEVGQNWIITSEPVDYEYGENVILTGNEMPGGSFNLPNFGLEDLIVLSTSADGHNVTFTTNLQYRHRSEIVEVEGRVIDMRCEIGLLTRNIVLQGDKYNSDGQLFGVHSMAMLSGIYRLENTEVRNCGQAFNFGRYCTHSHMAGDMRGSYVKANSIHHSYQRAVTTHNTRNWEVRDNVAYDVMGHAYFVEDGDEQNNYITGNLGILIRRSSALLMSDLKPAIFWTATPDNFWRDNVAAHSFSFGFWFEFPGSVTNTLFCPVGMQIGEFFNNTVHSNNAIGFRIYPQWTPVVNPCDGSSDPAPQKVSNLVSFRNGGNGLFSKQHGAIRHYNHVLLENGGDEISIVKYAPVDYDMNATFTNILCVGTLDSNFDESWDLGKHAIFGPQGEYFYVKGATFVNYGASGAITGCNECLVGSEMNQGGFTTRYEDLHFVNTPLRLFWSPTYKEILWDLDGSLAGVKDSMITMYYDVINWPDACTKLLPVSTFAESIRCGGWNESYRIRRMQLEGVTPSQLSYTDIQIRSEVGASAYFFLPLDTYGWVFPVVTGHNKTYILDWVDAGISAYTMQFTLGREAYLTETLNSDRIDETVMMEYTPHPWDYIPYSFGITYGWKTKVASLNSTKTLTQMADAHYKNGTLDVIVSSKGSTSNTAIHYGLSAAAQLCPPAGCPIPPVPTIGTPMLWSQASSWTSKKVPKGGEKVVIYSNMWIVMDINPPKLGCVYVYGKLSFQSNDTDPKSLSLYAQCLVVFGQVEILGTDNSTFNGNAQVVIYGGKGASLPVTMAEGVFLGSKVIAVAGSIVAQGRSKTHSWTKLNQTIYAGSSSLVLSQYVNWTVGDSVVLSPTAYLDEKGYVWSSKTNHGSSDETRIIKSISYQTDGSQTYTLLTLNSAVNHTHICETVKGERFCGAVGVLTRSVQFLSADSEDSKTTSYGFGAHIHVLDIAPSFRGYVNFKNVEFRNFGKINSDHYAITLAYKDYLHTQSVIEDCSFNGGYNMAVRPQHSYNISILNNVATGNWGGGVFIYADNLAFNVSNNLVIGTKQIPSVLVSTYPWVRPIAGFTIQTNQGVAFGNIAAGSEDQGFSVATSVFNVESNYRYLCSMTTGVAGAYDTDDSYPFSSFANNEAMACRGGLMLVTQSPSESVNDDCALVYGFKAWRSGHTGILSVDTQSNVKISRAVLAENHIGINLHFYKFADFAYSGVVNSKIIGSLGHAENQCTDLSDSVYKTGSQCGVFSETDPLGLLTTCNSIINGIYRRVGIMIPQWTNKPRTCAIAGRFAVCEPPQTPDRLCEMPWEKRYGLPIDDIYAELHIHNTEFDGFHDDTFNSTHSFSGYCNPSSAEDKSVAIAMNPTQFDMEPTVITSGLGWTEVDNTARLGFDNGAWGPANCFDHPCSGQNQMIINDLDGSMGVTGDKGQLLWNNPEYVAPYPLCYEVAELNAGLFFCPSVNGDDITQEFKQYSGVWLDQGPQIIQPLVVTRYFTSENRSFASYGPINDECAKRFYFSRFNLLFAHNTTQKLVTTGTIPSTGWTLRWDAPSASSVTIVNIFIQTGMEINVFVSDNRYSGFTLGTKLDRYPTLADPAASYCRDPQNRLLSVVLRGGDYRFYKFVVVPVAAVTIKMDMTLANFFSDSFIANMALLLQIPASRIKITDVRKGSVIVDFEVSPSNTVANDTSSKLSQIAELNELTSNLTVAVHTGALQTILNVTIQQVFAAPPVPDVYFDNLVDIAANATYNVTAARDAVVAAATPKSIIIMTYPTSMPSSQPSSLPSGKPSTQPTISPTSQPSHMPTSQPSRQPYSHPTSQPSRQPTRQPTSQPSRQPTSHPTSPTSHPTGQPTKQPIAHPSSRPSSEPTGQPTKQPYSAPTSRPSPMPTPLPSVIPTAVPTVTPSLVPSVAPTVRPSIAPTQQPTIAPSVAPSIAPTVSPSQSPSVMPTQSPTVVPSVVPTVSPTQQPSQPPSLVPTVAPTQVPTLIPTVAPTVTPSQQPSLSPSLAPTVTPSQMPTVIPTVVPTVAPTEQPTVPPTLAPSIAPSELPSEVPSENPSVQPSIEPSLTPSTLPSIAPSIIPTQQPSVVPSEYPSRAPTESPSNAPSVAPSVEPSLAPSLSPSFVPTTAPSKTPTASPTVSPSAAPSDVPTQAPTTELPSETPTVAPSHSSFDVITIVSFDCTQTITGCSASDLTEGSDELNAVVDALMITVEGDKQPTIDVTSVVDVEVTSRRRLTAGVDLSYSVHFSLDNTTQVKPGAVYMAYKTALTQFVTNNGFTSALQSSGYSALANAASTSVTFSNYTVTSVGGVPSEAPTKEPHHKSLGYNRDGLIAGVVLGGVALIAILIFIYYHERIPATRRIKVIPLHTKPEDLAETFMDIERLKTPQNIVQTQEGDANAVWDDMPRNEHFTFFNFSPDSKSKSTIYQEQQMVVRDQENAPAKREEEIGIPF